MRITNNNYTPNFYANLKSPKLRFKQKDFFVPIHGYGRNKEWANEVKMTADTAVNLIRKDTSAENVLKMISVGLKNANSALSNVFKKKWTGLLRTERPHWKSFQCETMTPYNCVPYKSYEARFDAVEKKPLVNPFADKHILPTTLEFNTLKHGEIAGINPALYYIFKKYGEIFPKYNHQDVKPENMEEINSTIAEIRWVLAHSTPWMRGSDAISNVFIRAMYKAIGIKTYPLAKGVSLDLEAYCTELKDYKKKFPAYFEKPPEIIE